MADLKHALASSSAQTYAAIQKYLEEKLVEAEAIDPLLAQSVRLLTHFSLRGGKAIRPFVASLAYELAGGKPHEGLSKALASIELHHKHILILDDIADRDEERYGGPTLEYAYREVMEKLSDRDHKAASFAMLDSVLLGSYSKELLVESAFSSEQLLACIHILDTIMYRDTLAGWQIHGMQCTQPLRTSTQEEFIKGLRLVTASYTFEGPFRIGLILAGNTDSKLEEALRLYADNVGTAFQIQDDILGLFGDTQKTGKPVGNDVREGKKTLLLQVAYERGSSEERDVLDRACGQPISTDMLRKVQEIVNATGSHDYSVQCAQEYCDKGIQALQDIPDSQAKQHLLDLAAYIINREK